MKKIVRRKKEQRRKKALRMLSVMLCFCLLITACPYMPGGAVGHAAGAGDGTSGNPWLCGSDGGGSVTATLSDDGTLTISGSGAMKEYTNTSDRPWNNSRASITSVVIESGVTSIGNTAFRGFSGLTSVTIPSSVTSIGPNAFYECSNLTGIDIPDGVTSIGPSAFYECSKLTGKVTIPKGVESIGRYAFYKCNSLTDVEIADGVKSIGYYAFSGCSSLTDIEIPSSVTSIEYNAFSSCSNLANVTISDGVKSIGKNAFYNCNALTRITIPESVTSIGTGLFGDCSSLTSIEVEERNGTYDSRSNCNAIIQTEGNILVAGCNNTTIPNSVTSIGKYAFSYCKNLDSIGIPNSVTSIEEYAFSECIRLTSIEIPFSVTSIGDRAFYHCGLSGEVTIPEGVESIGHFAFGSCWNLTGITIPSSVTSIGIGLFGGCSNLTSIQVAEGNTKYNSRENCNAIIQTEGNILVAGCKKTVIPEGVASIGRSAFYECGLTGIKIPEGVASIGNNAFYKCSKLTSIEIPSSVTDIGEWAFYSCSNLANVTMPEGVTSIGEWAFFQCSKLTGITIPSSVRSIGVRAFSECGLTGRVTIPEGVTSIGTSAFSECPGLTSANIPGSLTKIENGVFGKCTRLTSVTIGSGVKIIDQYAFNGCSGLKSIMIPGSVTSIEYGAFKDCGLTNVILEGTTTIPIVRNSTFEGCPAVATDAQGTPTQGIHIPGCEYLKKYLSTTGWRYYKSNISAEHSGFSYAVDAANAAVIQQSCACGSMVYGTATLSVKSGEKLTYTGGEITPVEVTCSGGWKEEEGNNKPDDSDIDYTNNVNVGTATASLTISGKTASLNFSIEAPEVSWQVSEGETKYGTLAEALNAAGVTSASNVTITVWDDKTAVLTANHTLPDGATLIVPVGSKVVSDKDGVVLTVKGRIENAGSFAEPIRLDIESGTLINTGTLSCDIKSNAGSIDNTGGTISGSVENTEGGIVEGGTVTGTVTGGMVSGGTVNGSLTNKGIIKNATITGTINLPSEGKIIDSVINGTVIDKGGKVSYESSYTEEINGTGVITPPGGSGEGGEGSTPEQKLVAALGGAAMKSSDGTVKLVANVNLTENPVIINGDVKIDLNGHTITAPGGKPAIQIDGGNVTIQDTSVTSSGAILGGSGSAGQPGAPGIRNTGTLTIEGGTVSGGTGGKGGSGGAGIENTGSGGVTIKGGTVSGGKGGESGGKGGDGIKNTGSGKVDITEGGKVEKGSDGSSGNISGGSGSGNSSGGSSGENISGDTGRENISDDSNRENISGDSGWESSGDTGTWIETKPDGTRVETTTGTRPDGTKTETVTETKPDGTKTESVTETRPDGTKTESVTETKSDGTKMQTVTETKSDGTKMQTVTETKADGTKTETVMETKPDGTKTQTVVKTKPNGTKTETVAETKPNGAKTETVVKTKPDGAKTENVTKTNASGEVVKITENVTNADGVLTSVKETSPVPDIAKNTTGTVTVKKDGKGKITSAKASVTYEVKKGKKAVFSADVMEGVVETAGTESVDVTMTVRDSKGKTKYKVKANTEDLAGGEELYIYRINHAIDEYEMVNPEIYKANKKGNVAVDMEKKTSYVLVNSEQSEQIASEIVKTIQPESRKVFLRKKQKTHFELSSEVNENNIKSITYSTGGRSVVTVSKKGRITGRKRGKTVVKAKVVLLNGMTKTINMKIIVK